jgi:thiamine biosynthesis protein ThiS
MGASKTGIAVARNDEVVLRSAHAHEKIFAGDRIEIITAVAGG